MYKSFYGLTKNPFNVNPDPHYLYLTPRMRQSLDELTYGIEHRKGLMLLTGEVGTGKTTLVNHLLSWLEHQSARTAFIFNSHLDSSQLFDFILADFEIPSTPASRENPLLAFNEWLLARYQARELVVLIVDEAQGLPAHVLEEIRLLLNMETPHEKMLQVILSGQPELEVKLKRPDLRQLQQRIALRCKTAPLSLHEVYGYVEDRLHTAGAGNIPVFSPQAIEAISTYSRGIPRVINLLCENALINGYAEQLRPIPAGIIEDAARELQFDEMRPVAPRLRAIDGSYNGADTHGGAADLHSILAKIEADAEAARRSYGRLKTSPYLVSTPVAVRHTTSRGPESSLRERAEVVSGASANKIQQQPVRSSTATLLPLAPATALDSTNDISRGKRGGWVKQTAPLFAALPNLAEARKFLHLADARRIFSSKVLYLGEAQKLLQNVKLRATAKTAVDTVRRFEFPRRARLVATEFATEIKIGAEETRGFVLQTLAPAARVHAAAAKKSMDGWGSLVEQWWARNVGNDIYVNGFIASASLSTLLYFVARRVDPTQSWQRPGQTILGLLVLLMTILSVGLGITLLVQNRGKLRMDGLALKAKMVRWLRAPIHPMAMREIESLAGKAQAERRL